LTGFHESKFQNFAVKTNKGVVLNKNSSKKSAIVIRPGTLYVVATPIGNRDDITLRALNILRAVDQIAAETRKFLALQGIKNSLISYHEHNEAERTPELVAKLHQGTSIALVCNAGTPTVSDPGYRLIEAALANNLNVIPIPGVSAANAALSVSGLPTDSFVFIGFLPRKKTKRLRLLSEIASQPRTVIFYESPKRILMLLGEISDTMGNRHAVLAREMTKLHEEFIRGRLSEILEMLSGRPDVKGECTLLVAGCKSGGWINWDTIRAEIQNYFAAEDKHVSEVVRDIAQKFKLPKNKVYEEALKIRNQMTEIGSQTTDE
jgi:16S rRNA (cytidine1402-2'-O)-methyltransferase